MRGIAPLLPLKSLQLAMGRGKLQYQPICVPPKHTPPAEWTHSFRS